MIPQIICVVGPTATGKTKMGVALAHRFGGEVVSVDSMQIYRGMAIGTAAPTPEEMEGIPHHMVGVADPAESWSVARFSRRSSASSSRAALSRATTPAVKLMFSTARELMSRRIGKTWCRRMFRAAESS